MNNPNLNQAREWAKSLSARPATDREYATANIIQSLPDHWVDVEELRDWMNDFIQKEREGTPREWLADAFTELQNRFLTSKPPTLADMTQEEREACQWMQADVKLDISGATVRRVIAHPGSADMNVSVWAQYGGGNFVDAESVTPLPDLPKLQWPGGVVDAEIADEPETVESGSIHTPMQPSDVPPNEPWLIEVDGRKAVGTRYQDYAVSPWAVAPLDGSFAADHMDSDVTLIHKIVAEPPALPEGMRLADHEWEGRVVVSPKVDHDGDYKAFLPDPENGTGAAWKYVHKSKLTFLDGEK